MYCSYMSEFREYTQNNKFLFKVTQISGEPVCVDADDSIILLCTYTSNKNSKRWAFSGKNSCRFQIAFFKKLRFRQHGSCTEYDVCRVHALRGQNVHTRVVNFHTSFRIYSIGFSLPVVDSTHVWEYWFSAENTFLPSRRGQ